MTLWEVDGFIAANIWEAHLLWCEYTYIGLIFSIFTTALASWLLVALINDKRTDN